MPAKKAAPAPQGKEPMGLSPANMAQRNKPGNSWCPKDIDFDPMCDPQNPKTITNKQVVKAMAQVRERIPETPLIKSRCCEKFGLNLYYKVETQLNTGSFKERGALYALLRLTPEEQNNGVICASIGNFGLALAYWGMRLCIPVKIVFPEDVHFSYVDKCKVYRAKVVLEGSNLNEAMHKAWSLASESHYMYINGTDHPSVIAGTGTIGIEILEQLPEVDTILVPVGGGALIAGICAAVKATKEKKEVDIYGVEPDKCCCFFKAMQKEGIFETEVGYSIASSLGVPTAGCNSFHTAKTLITKMVLVDDDWITRAVAHLAEEEKLVVEGAGATSLGALFAYPTVLPELQDKNIVCIVTGGNLVNCNLLPRCLDRARAIDGRLIKLTMLFNADDPQLYAHVMSMIANVGCNVKDTRTEHGWLTVNDLRNIKLHLTIETTDLEHACQLKRVMMKLFPEQCEFTEEPFSPVPVCVCYPKKKP